MKRYNASLRVAGALLTASILGACGGGSSSTALPPPAPSAPAHSSTPGAHIRIVVDRSRSSKHAARTRSDKRRREFISPSAQGLQVTVALSSSPGATQVVNADISAASPLCTTSGTVATCTIAIPTLGASEIVTATELDQAPLQAANGYGSGFASAPSGPNVLAIGTARADITLGAANTIALGLNPVAGILADGGPTTGGSEFQADPSIAFRLVTTGAAIIPAQGLAIYGLDVANNNVKSEPSPLPYVDVNGNAQPVAIAVSPETSGLYVDAIPVPVPHPLPAFSSTASIPDESYVWPGYEWVVGVETDATFTSSATITVSNNLSAINSFTGTSYASTLVYTVDPITVSAPTPQTISLGANQTATVVGTDPHAPATGMNAESAFGANDALCIDTTTSGQQDASISRGAFDTATFTQSFTVTPLAAGTCTFVLYDVDSGVTTLPVTITVTP